jgi:hypothetical protein
VRAFVDLSLWLTPKRGQRDQGWAQPQKSSEEKQGMSRQPRFNDFKGMKTYS